MDNGKSGMDKDGADPVEVWGRRIGRSLAVIAALGLLIWIIRDYL